MLDAAAATRLDKPRLQATSSRIAALDVFRGMTMAGMVIVNNPGTWSAVYWPLEHAEWNGWTPTDLIFPFFLFIVGISLTLSRRTLTSRPVAIVRRAAIIVGCGLFMAGFPFFNPGHWRIPGVLQRIGVCYLAAAFLYRWTTGKRQAAVLSGIGIAILAAYWMVLVRFGDLSPEGNVGAAIDRALFGTHLWRVRWDPEGLLSTAPAVATTVCGVLTGLWLSGPSSRERRMTGLLAGGAAAFVLGEAWGIVFPINKQLWTSSYVLLTAGAAAMTLAACIRLTEIPRTIRWMRPFEILGQNALALFVVSGLLGKALLDIRVQGRTLQAFIYERGFAWMAGEKNASLLYALAFLALMYAMCDVMYRRRIFLRA
jgi:predicted acyltransferase